MPDVDLLLQSAPIIFAIVLSVTVFFLIARVIQARQPIALAFALTPMLLYWAVQQALI